MSLRSPGGSSSVAGITSGTIAGITAFSTGQLASAFSIQWGASANDAVSVSTLGTFAVMSNAAGSKVQLLPAAGNAARLASDSQLGFNSTTNLTGGAIDTGIGRNSAGVAEVNTGTLGTLGNLAVSKLTKYNGSTTAGAGVPGIVAAGRATAQSAANASVSTFTVGAADASFEVSMNMNVTVSTTLVTTMTCTYTDESNTARTMVLPVAQLSGSFIAAGAVTGTGAWETPVMHIRCKAATAITLLTSAGTFTAVTYTVEGIIKQTS